MYRLPPHIVLVLALTIAGNARAADDLDTIRKQLSSADAKIREAAVTRAGKVEGQTKALTELIIPLLKDLSPDVRFASLRALGDLKAVSAVNALISALEDPESGVAGMAAFILGKMGADAKAAIPMLIKHYCDDDPRKTMFFQQALKDIGSNAIPVLREELKGERRGTAAFVLGNLREDAAVAAEDIGTLLADANSGIRECAALALAKIGSKAQAALPYVIAALKKEKVNSHSRPNLCWVLIHLGVDARPAIPALVEALENDDAPIGPNAKDALRAILKALPKTENDSNDVRSALEALAKRRGDGRAID